MAYKVTLDDSVALDAAAFSAQTLRHWSACLVEIASDPFPRDGVYVERVIPIPPFPMRTFLYEIAEETSISGETLFVFTAEFFPEYSLVYVVNDDEREVALLALRAKR